MNTRPSELVSPHTPPPTYTKKDLLWTGLPLYLELIGGSSRKIWRTIRPLTYSSTFGLCEAPELWVTDLTSKPWFVFWIPKEGDHTPPSVIHDVLYAKGYIYIFVNGVRRRRPIKRIEADKIYLEAMTSRGVKDSVKKQIYAGVRLGGWLSWRRYRRRDKNNSEDICCT